MHTATTSGQYIKIIDAKSGSTKRNIKFAGTLIQGPIVSDKEMSITVRVSPSLTYVLVYSMPHGTLKRRIRI